MSNYPRLPTENVTIVSVGGLDLTISFNPTKLTFLINRFSRKANFCGFFSKFVGLGTDANEKINAKRFQKYDN